MGAASALGSLAGAMAPLSLVGLVLWAVLAAAHWKMLEKAGDKGWKAIVPVYGDYALCTITAATGLTQALAPWSWRDHVRTTARWEAQ